MDYCNEICVEEQEWEAFDDATYDLCFGECLRSIADDAADLEEELCIENCLSQSPPTGENLAACLATC